MSNWRSTGITTILLLISFMIIAVTVASVITKNTTDTTMKYDVNKRTKEVINEITSYIQIRDQKGKYSNINGELRIEKIALLISPLVSSEIDVSKLTIQIDNGEIVKILTYNGDVSHMEENSLFEHSIWNKLKSDNFGFISIIDSDDSLLRYDTINDYYDNMYLVFRLQEDMTMGKKDTLVVTLLPSIGISQSIILEAPLPIKTVVTFE